jgi:hypothetical protein
LVEKHKRATPADQQIKRLEALKQEKDLVVQKKPAKTAPMISPRTAVERTLQRLEAMRELAAQSGPAMPPVLPPVEEMQESFFTKAESKKAIGPISPEVPSEIKPVPPQEPSLENQSALVLEMLPPPPPPPVSSPEAVFAQAMSAPPPPPALPSQEPLVAVSAPPPPPLPLEDDVNASEDLVGGEMTPANKSTFQRFEGRFKNVKLSVAQMKTLEQMFDVDPRLYPARVLRIALNQWLGTSNLPEDQALEPLSRDALIRIQKGL